jgi:hypothetical protein
MIRVIVKLLVEEARHEIVPRADLRQIKARSPQAEYF